LRDRRRTLPATHNFFGVIDGCPDDQINPARGDDCRHVLACVLAPTREHIVNLVNDMLTVEGPPIIKLMKWGSIRKKKKDTAKRGFVERLFAVWDKHPQVSVMIYCETAAAIRHLWENDIAGLNTSPNRHWVKSYQFNGKKRISMGPIHGIQDGVPVSTSCSITLEQAMVLNWYASALLLVYQRACQSSIVRKAGRILPEFHLHTDRFPGDTSGNVIKALSKLMERETKNRLSVSWTETEDDGPEDFLADCFAAWMQEGLRDSKSGMGKRLMDLIDQSHQDRRLIIYSTDAQKNKAAPGGAAL